MNKKQAKVMSALTKVAEGYKDELKEAGATIGKNIIEKGMLPQEALAIPRSKTEAIYAQAYQLYNSGNYKKAYQTFELLSLLNERDPRYTFGMAACLQNLGDYKNAFIMFMQSASKDQQNPVPYYHAADCCLKMNDKISAVVMLHLVVENSKDKPEFQFIKDRSLILKENLSQELNEEAKNLPKE